MPTLKQLPVLKQVPTKQELNQVDPLTKQPEEGSIGDDTLSPMDPPEDPYAPPGLDRVAVEDMHPLLQTLCEEHSTLSAALNIVDESLKEVENKGFDADLQNLLLGFCQVVDWDFIPHSRREEMTLFPLLHERLIQSGEHSRGRTTTTAVELMLDDHLKFIQLSAVITNFLKIAPHLPDDGSTLVLRDAAVRHTKTLIALLRLHMFREDNIVFPSAHRLITTEELDALQAGAKI